MGRVRSPVFAVSLNTARDQALVHSTDCRHYRRRKRFAGWSQEFETKDAALLFARESGLTWNWIAFCCAGLP
jgi:hypothetical protein